MYGKRVVVIGIGNSGGDIAVEGSRVAEEVGTFFVIALIHLINWNQTYFFSTTAYISA